MGLKCLLLFLFPSLVFAMPGSLNETESCEHRLLREGIDFLVLSRLPFSKTVIMNFALNNAGVKSFPIFRFEPLELVHEPASFRWMREEPSFDERLLNGGRVFSIERAFSVDDFIPRLKDREIFRFDPFAESSKPGLVSNFLATGFQSETFEEVFALETIFSSQQLKASELALYEFSFYELYRLLRKGGTLYIGTVHSPLLLEGLYSWSRNVGAELSLSRRFQNCFLIRRL